MLVVQPFPSPQQIALSTCLSSKGKGYDVGPTADTVVNIYGYSLNFFQAYGWRSPVYIHVADTRKKALEFFAARQRDYATQSNQRLSGTIRVLVSGKYAVIWTRRQLPASAVHDAVSCAQ